MPKRRQQRRNDSDSAPLTRRTSALHIDTVMWWSIGAVMLLLPLLASPTGRDVFRLPKLLFFRAEAIALVALALIRLALEVPPRWRNAVGDPVLQLTAATLLWTTITAAAADSRAVSFAQLGDVAAMLLFFALTYLLASGRSLRALAFLIVPAVITALIAMAQARNIWTPFALDATIRRMRIAALLGNANDIGMYLTPAVAVSAALIVLHRGKRRFIDAAIVLVLAGGIAASQTLTAMIAVAAFAAVVVSRRRRLAVIALPVLLVIAATTAATFPSVAVRTFDVIGWLKRGDYDRIVSGRSIAFLAAARMARDHPLLGLGPGGFAWHYFDYATGVREAYPKLVSGSMTEGVNFADVHNDHLQILAEYGVIGYGLMAAGVAVFVKRVRGAAGLPDERHRFVSFLGMPFLVSLFILMAAQFPLHLVTATAAYAFIGALLLRWSAPA